MKATDLQLRADEDSKGMLEEQSKTCGVEGGLGAAEGMRTSDGEVSGSEGQPGGGRAKPQVTATARLKTWIFFGHY